MADDLVVLQCEACGTRLKVRAVTARIMKDVKCPKCGRKVSTRSLAPAAAEPAASSSPLEPASVPAPAPEPVAPLAAVPMPATVAATPAAVEPAPPPAGPPAAPEAEAPELRAAQARIAELEQQVKDLTARAEALAAASSSASAAEGELGQLRKVVAEQEERLSQLQQLWYEKEKEARTAYASAQRAQQERKFTVEQLEAVLRSYHEAEIEAATERINNLNQRLQKFLVEQAARGVAT